MRIPMLYRRCTNVEFDYLAPRGDQNTKTLFYAQLGFTVNSACGCSAFPTLAHSGHCILIILLGQRMKTGSSAVHH
jgi:hypothetical protein